MKSRSEIFNLLISNEPVTVEEYTPYATSLKILLEDYYCTDEVLVRYLGGYGTVFYIPEKDLHEECMNDYTGDGMLYDEDDYQDFESQWMAYVGELPEPLITNKH